MCRCHRWEIIYINGIDNIDISAITDIAINDIAISAMDGIDNDHTDNIDLDVPWELVHMIMEAKIVYDLPWCPW